METLTTALERMSTTRSVALSPARRSLSRRQEEEVTAFRRLWPSYEHVLLYFSPAKWAGVLAKKSHALLYPEMSLMILDEQYEQGLASQVILNNLANIYVIACPKEPFIEEDMRRLADMIVSRYGGELSLFGIYYYLASYLTDYKDTYSRFDVTDIVSQCGRFMNWWRNALAKMEEKQQADESKDVGDTALISYLRREYLAKGLDVRDSALYKAGKISKSVLESL